MLIGARDQELRFTVHDSPDYYQLKVSVFNDDKKTELIGETWVPLDQIIVPGGGQNDLWHNLNCKGRYAGEIRIEITYYDTRPRDEKVEERRQSIPVNKTMEQPGSGLSGPRQPKPVKRRPLPADPTGSPHASILPHTPPSNVPQSLGSQQRYVEPPNNQRTDATPSSGSRHQRLQESQQGGSPLNYNPQIPDTFNGITTTSPVSYRSKPDELPVFDLSGQDNYPHDQNLTFTQTSQNQQSYDGSSPYDMEHGDAWQSRPSTQEVQTLNAMIYSNSSPAIIDARPRQDAPAARQHSSSSQPRSQSYDANPTLHYPRDDDYNSWPSVDGDAIDEYAAPPPPPAHRSSGLRSSPQVSSRVQSEPYIPIAAPAPLNIKDGRGSMGGSPLSQLHSSSSYQEYPSISPSNSQSYSNTAPSVSSRTSHGQPGKPRPQSPVRDYGSTPPSLVPGYEPSIAADESERLMHENRIGLQQQSTDQQSPQYQQASAKFMQTRSQPIQGHFQSAPTSTLQTRPQQTQQYHHAPSPTAQSRLQSTPHNVQSVQDRRAHRFSVPNTNPRAISSAPQTPMRKSLSPQPGSAPAERRRSGVPFSPDSFDAFNPSLADADIINQSGVNYNTPEQAKDVYREHERQKKLGDGPIIGSDGRIIDPSDHLPTDTWAPEPEQKKPRKGPEVTIRFRQSPRGAQPLPSTSRPALSEVRPHPVTTPIYAHGPDNGSPSSGGRNRLQKKSNAVTAQPASSPIVPTLNTKPRSSPLRSAVFDYPLRERENYGGYGSSPTYARISPGNIPPPVPGKVPIHAGQEDWSMSALSEEMKSIDIGIGGGQGRNRRSRYGL